MKRRTRIWILDLLLLYFLLAVLGGSVLLDVCHNEAPSKYVSNMLLSLSLKLTSCVSGHHRDRAERTVERTSRSYRVRNKCKVQQQGRPPHFFAFSNRSFEADWKETRLQVVPGVGLCLAFWEIHDSSEGIVTHGNGCLYYKGFFFFFLVSYPKEANLGN
jgi:hypothetical protein